MSLVKHPIFTSIFCSFLLFLGGCSEAPIADPPLKDPVSEVYPENYENVWRAVQLALRKYPIRTNSMESGILETDYIKGDKLFSDPNDSQSKAGHRYKITVRAVKGKINRKPMVKITIQKNAEAQPDFFSEYKPVQTNGLEEQTLLYRVGRFLEIDKIQTKINH